MLCSAPCPAVQPGGAGQTLPSPLPTSQPAQPVALPGPVQSVAPQQLLASAAPQPVSSQIQPVPVSPEPGVSEEVPLPSSPTDPSPIPQVLLQPHFIKADSLLLTAVKTDAGSAKTSSIATLAPSTSGSATPLQVPVGLTTRELWGRRMLGDPTSTPPPIPTGTGEWRDHPGHSAAGGGR